MKRNDNHWNIERMTNFFFDKKKYIEEKMINERLLNSYGGSCNNKIVMTLEDPQSTYDLFCNAIEIQGNKK